MNESTDHENIINWIEHWRTTFGLPVRKTWMSSPDIDMIREIYLAEDLIEEETKELRYAVQDNFVRESNNLTNAEEGLREICDAIGDLYFVVTQMCNVIGVDPYDIVKTVYESNMSKLCDTLDEAELSITKYKAQDIDTRYEEVLVNGSVKYKILRESDNKVLKGINFKEPDWSWIKIK